MTDSEVKEEDFKVIQSSLIIDNQEKFIDRINKSYTMHQKMFRGQDSTWSYGLYNIFSITSPSILMYDLFVELKGIINDYLPEYKYKWMQAWVNYHSSDEVLDWHNHSWDYHGYISIDPKNTTTIFEGGYKVDNKVGNIYIGPGNRRHKVVVNEEYSGPRITIGYDVQVFREGSRPQGNLSLLPL